jgi:small subunit ribosomal protein S1
MKEFEASPFKGITEKLPVGSKATGTVKSIINFGAYIELFPGVVGLLRNIDYSWTQRVRNLNEVLTVGSQIEVFIIDVSEEKQQVALGIKQFTPNPWETIETKFNKEDTYSGTVDRAINQGYIVRLSDQIEAFIPKSKLTPETAKSINIGDTLSVKILDIVPKNSSIVLCQEGYVAPVYNNDEERPKRQDQGRDRERGNFQRQKNSHQSQSDSEIPSGFESAEQSSVTFFDMLDESQMNKISKLSK